MEFSLWLESQNEQRRVLLDIIYGLTDKNPEVYILADKLSDFPLGQFLSLKLQGIANKDVFQNDPLLSGTTVKVNPPEDTFGGKNRYARKENEYLMWDGEPSISSTVWYVYRTSKTFLYWLRMHSGDYPVEFQYVMSQKNLVSGTPQRIKTSSITRKTGFENLRNHTVVDDQWRPGNSLEDYITIPVPSNKLLYHLASVLAMQ